MRLLLFILSLFIISLNYVSLRAQDYSEGKVVFDSYSITLPSLSEKDAPLTVNFSWVNNSRNVSILITSAFVSCPCVTTEFDNELVPPGGRSLIKVTFNPKGKVGKYEKKVTVFTSLSSQKPTAILRLNIEVVPDK
ncbi:MAG: DUF1573 domain-containing protein [Bacteroidales bacterium]|jgi:hypothetical protein|nr:DUF1573 domain-containing protein [Bacteroidales bacterium]MDY6001134.1 DUF1573 domain-containing protein [Candidatus Cryptobacteroides sp.]